MGDSPPAPPSQIYPSLHSHTHLTTAGNFANNCKCNALSPVGIGIGKREKHRSELKAFPLPLALLLLLPHLVAATQRTCRKTDIKFTLQNWLPAFGVSVFGYLVAANLMDPGNRGIEASRSGGCGLGLREGGRRRSHHRCAPPARKSLF